MHILPMSFDELLTEAPVLSIVQGAWQLLPYEGSLCSQKVWTAASNRVTVSASVSRLLGLCGRPLEGAQETICSRPILVRRYRTVPELFRRRTHNGGNFCLSYWVLETDLLRMDMCGERLESTVVISPSCSRRSWGRSP